jgi:hypothetical protein
MARAARSRRWSLTIGAAPPKEGCEPKHGRAAWELPSPGHLRHFRLAGRFVAMDQPASNALTRARRDRTPTHPTLVEDLEAGHYTD